MFRKIATAALLAGSLAGLCLWLIQQWQVLPLILEAETYEISSEAQIQDNQHAPSHGHGGHDATEAAEWAPDEGVERMLYTALTNALAGIGFGLVLGAAMGWRGIKKRWHGLLWGAAGFAAFYLGPTLGLPAELPGTEAAPLLERQAWWLLTVLTTASGLWLLAFKRTPLLLGIGALLLIAPHIFGAPHPDSHEALAPAELIRQFGSATLIANLIFWLVLGMLTAVAHKRLGLNPDPAAE